MIRLARIALICVAAAIAACKKDEPTGIDFSAAPSRDALNGAFSCGQMFAYYPGPQGAGWYTSSCTGYRNTFPSRRDSIESMDFQIFPTGIISRDDFDDGSVQYDTATAELVAQYAHRSPDFYTARYNGTTLQLRQEFVPFDISGDGQPDSLILVFNRTSR